MRLTMLVLLLPVMMFFGFLFVIHRGDALAIPAFIIWISTTLVCFGRGFYIFRKQRYLALCCFAVACMQIILAILPALTGRYK
jgi:hypothetical protein